MHEDVNPLFHHFKLADLGQCQELDLQKHQPGWWWGRTARPQCADDSPREGVSLWKSACHAVSSRAGLSYSLSTYELPVDKMRVLLRKSF